MNGPWRDGVRDRNRDPEPMNWLFQAGWTAEREGQWPT